MFFSASGKATKVEPDGGWAESGLSTLFTIRTASTNTTPTSVPTSKATDVPTSTGLSGGAIAGIVIGAVGGVAIACGALFFWLRSRRISKQNKGLEVPEKDGLPSYSSAASEGTAELVGTHQAAELAAKQGEITAKPGTPEDPAEKDAGTVQGPHPSARQNGLVEME